MGEKPNQIPTYKLNLRRASVGHKVLLSDVHVVHLILQIPSHTGTLQDKLLRHCLAKPRSGREPLNVVSSWRDFDRDFPGFVRDIPRSPVHTWYLYCLPALFNSGSSRCKSRRVRDRGAIWRAFGVSCAGADDILNLAAGCASVGLCTH